MIILIGESGSGKDSIQKELVDHFGFHKIVTYTTRPPRAGEVDGETYHFISDEKFEEMNNKLMFGETAEYRGWKYASAIEDYNDSAVIILTPHGLRKIKKMPLPLHIVSIYVDVPRRERLIRILKRGDDIEEAYRRSLSDVGMFDGIADEVDFVVNNSSNVCTSPRIPAYEIHQFYYHGRR